MLQAAMGASGSRSGGDDLALPPQQIVSGRAAAAAAKGVGKGKVVKAKHSTTDSGVKIPLVWDLKHTLVVERVGPSRAGTWRLAAEFTAEVPCTLDVHVHCKEVKDGELLAFKPAGEGGPPSFSQQFEAGRHSLNMDGGKAIDLVHYPLHRYWKYHQKTPDVVPIVLSLKARETSLGMPAQSIVHLSLEVVSNKDKDKQAGKDLKAVVLVQKVVVQGQEYKLEEIFGIAELGKEHSHDESEMGEPCVICLSEPRTTALLPCRHLCVCEQCALQLKLRRDRCPICRAEVQDLQVFDVKDKANDSGQPASSTT